MRPNSPSAPSPGPSKKYQIKFCLVFSFWGVLYRDFYSAAHKMMLWSKDGWARPDEGLLCPPKRQVVQLNPEAVAACIL